jgi:hypothetical protein
LFGDAWDSQLQYEDDSGTIVGCYIDRHYIQKVDEEINEHYAEEAASLEAWMREQEKEGGGEDMREPNLDTTKGERRDESDG